MKFKERLITLFFLLNSFLISGPLFSETPEEAGLKISLNSEKANNGFLGEVSEMKMILEDAHGTKISRKMKGKTM